VCNETKPGAQDCKTMQLAVARVLGVLSPSLQRPFQAGSRCGSKESNHESFRRWLIEQS